jgi:hypothetical protein
VFPLFPVIRFSCTFVEIPGVVAGAPHSSPLFTPERRQSQKSVIVELTLPPSFSAPPTFLDLEYARSYLPVLAALLLSGHVREGDVLDVPIPHPQAWTQTVAYVYTGRGDLTDPIRENIIYLGGKV